MYIFIYLVSPNKPLVWKVSHPQGKSYGATLLYSKYNDLCVIKKNTLLIKSVQRKQKHVPLDYVNERAEFEYFACS